MGEQADTRAVIGTHDLAMAIQQAWDKEWRKPMDSASRGLDYQMARLAAETTLEVVIRLAEQDAEALRAKPANDARHERDKELTAAGMGIVADLVREVMKTGAA